MEYLFSNGFVPTSDENRYAVGGLRHGQQAPRAIRNFGMNFPTSGDVPEPGKQLMIDTLNFSDLGYDVTGPTLTSGTRSTRTARSGARSTSHVRQLLARQVRRRLPVRRRGSPVRVRQRRAAAVRVPGQPALDPARLRRDAADADEPVDAPGPRRGAGGRPDALRRREPEGAVARLRPQRHGRERHQPRTAAWPRPTPIRRRTWSPVGTTPATVNVRRPRTSTAIRSTTLGSSSATTRPGSRRSRTPIPPPRRCRRIAGLNLDDTVKFAPGTYEFIAQAPGLRVLPLPRDASARERLEDDRDPSCAHELGVVCVGRNGLDGDGGSERRNLIDDTEGTQLDRDRQRRPAPLSVDGKKVTVDLGGTEPINVKLRPGQRHAVRPARTGSRLCAQFEVWACNANKGARLRHGRRLQRRCTRARRMPSQATRRGPSRRT